MSAKATASVLSQLALSFTPAPVNLLQRKCACGGSAGVSGECEGCQKKTLTGEQPSLVQPKLRISQPNDIYEQEADRVADIVMRMPEPHLQRQVEPEEEDDEEVIQTKRLFSREPSLIQRQVDPEEEETLQTKRAFGETPVVTPAIQSAIQGLWQGGGQPLDPTTRAFMEPRFGRDFSNVRIHTGGESDQLARGLNARAFTFGNDVVFRTGEFNPGSSSGKRLFAHELTHVLQQKASGATHIQRAEVAGSCEGLKDSAEDINAKVNAELANARKLAGPRGDPGQSGQLGIPKLAYKRLGGKTAGWIVPFSQIEYWTQKQLAKTQNKVRASDRAASKYAGVTFTFTERIWNALNFLVRRKHRAKLPTDLFMADNLLVNKICIGDDKLGHFFQQGWEYFRRFRRISRRNSKTVEDGQRAAERYGDRLERGKFGLRGSGVYSKADLEANRQGLLFYRELETNPRLVFDIKRHVNPLWSEEFNPSQYKPRMAKQIWSNLLEGEWTTEKSNHETQVSLKIELTSYPGDVVVGEYDYEDSDMRMVKGQLRGTVSYNRKMRRAVDGVDVDFQWMHGTERGYGRWSSVGEAKLEGIWGAPLRSPEESQAPADAEELATARNSKPALLRWLMRIGRKRDRLQRENKQLHAGRLTLFRGRRAHQVLLLQEHGELGVSLSQDTLQMLHAIVAKLDQKRGQVRSPAAQDPYTAGLRVRLVKVPPEKRSTSKEGIQETVPISVLEDNQKERDTIGRL